MRFTHLLRGSASLVVLAAFAAGSAYAQDEGEVDNGNEIVVTAQKREQNLQDVPIVVTTLSQESLENAGVRDIKDMQILTPGLTVTSTSNEAVTTARIRGIGTVGDNPGLESSVGVVIDGVYRPRNGVGFGDLGQMQRIEILKGPQGTLFGKNTSAGVINIITEAPSFEAGFEGELTFGNYGAKGAAASITGPLWGDKLAGRLYAAGRVRDGFYDVDTGDGPRVDTDDANQNFKTFRGQLLFVPTDAMEWRLIADFTERSERCCAAVQTRTGPTAAIVDAFALGTGVLNPADPDRRLAFANRPTDQNIEDSGISLEGNIDLDGLGATLTTITGLRNWQLNYAQDSDFSGADIWYRPNNGNNTAEFDTLSQEVRLAGEAGRLNWLVGGFYADEELGRRDSILYGADYELYWSTAIINYVATMATRLGFTAPSTANGFNFINEANGAAQGLGQAFVPGQGYVDTYNQDSTTLAFFTNNTFAVTEQLELTLGLRWTKDEKSVVSKFTNSDSGAGCGALLANSAQVGAALAGRGAGPAPALTSLAGTAIALACLPSSNPNFNNLTTNQSHEEDAWTGTAKVQYRFNEDFMAYASYARGYKGFGYNLDRTQRATALVPLPVVPESSTFFPAETVNSYEVGAKTDWLNGSLLLNATVFHQVYEDFQLNTFLGTTFVVESIPEVTSTGVDADVFWFSPVEGLSFQGGLTYAKTEYGNFTAADFSDPSRFNPLSLLPGSTMSFAPEWSVTGALNYDRDYGAFRFLGNLSAKYTSEYNTKSDLLAEGEQGAMTLLNGRIGFGAADESWTLELWGQNLTDETYKQVVFNAPLQGSAFYPYAPGYNPTFDTNTYNAFLGAPRTYGATLRVQF
ncbi:MAG TPA: TonB-dependent receptor [Caulobacteraceae bacterium]|nr:TonB-dependent receptor [Caulobacteraceae bacterium]